MHISTTPQDFLDQSLLLIQAHPRTTRITTTYSTTPPNLHRQKITRWLASKRKSTPALSTPSNPPTSTTTTTPQHTAHLTLKTYDPTSGTTITYTTREVRDVGRLVGVLGRAARGMGGVGKIQPQAADTVMGDAGQVQSLAVPATLAAVDVPRVGSPAPGAVAGRVGTPVPAAEKQGVASGGGQAQGQSQGKGKKKKGKK